MIVDLFRGLMIILKFLFHDVWLWLYMVLFGKQNQRIKAAYNKRVGSKKRKEFY